MVRHTARKMKRTKRSSDLLTYTGPSRLPNPAGRDAHTLKVNLTQNLPVTSTAAGKYANYIDTIYAANATDWPFFAATYQEYRTLAIQVKYTPAYNAAYNASHLYNIGAMASVHVVPTTPVSVDELLQMDTARRWHPGQPLMIEWKMTGAEEAQFINCSTIASHGAIPMYVDGLTNSTLYGALTITHVVEFRSRK